MKAQVLLKMNVSETLPGDLLQRLIAGHVEKILTATGFGKLESASAIRLDELPPMEAEPLPAVMPPGLRRAVPEITDTFVCTITTRQEHGGWRAGYAVNGLSFVSPFNSVSAINGLVEKMSTYFRTTAVEFNFQPGNMGARVRFERNPEL